MVRSGEPGKEEESNEQMNSVYPLITALHSIYMDDPSFTESVGEVVFSILQYYQAAEISSEEKVF